MQTTQLTKEQKERIEARVAMDLLAGNVSKVNMRDYQPHIHTYVNKILYKLFKVHNTQWFNQPMYTYTWNLLHEEIPIE